MSEQSEIPSLCSCTQQADKAKPCHLMETDHNVNATLVHSAQQASLGKQPLSTL